MKSSSVIRIEGMERGPESATPEDIRWLCNLARSQDARINSFTGLLGKIENTSRDLRDHIEAHHQIRREPVD